ncbi:MAG TPA: DUF72 domain-containing protein [Acidobacteriaceae bacterium]|nr:DUF72 domain-containing protein [Acidobacteriaceae bacterium]
MAPRGNVRVGISGWTYKPWRGVFFPAKLPQKRELEFASSAFRTIEVNGTFYSLQRPSSFQSWAERTPDDFVFSIKASRYITHVRRLRSIEVPLANFFAAGLLKLGPKLGPILWQFPPNFQYSYHLLEEFFLILPRDTEAAAVLAQGHDRLTEDRCYAETDKKRPIRHAIEIRHSSFVNPEFIKLLRKHNIGLVCADAVEWPRLMDVTSDFIYCRLHGSEQLYTSGYDRTSIARWGERAVAWASGADFVGGDYASQAHPRPRVRRDVFVYFDNDAKVRAPRDARALQSYIDKQLEGIRKPKD